MAVDSLERDCRPALPRLDSGYDVGMMISYCDPLKTPSRILLVYHGSVLWFYWSYQEGFNSTT